MVPALDNHLIALTTVTDQFPGQVSTEQPFTRKQLEVELLNIAGGTMDPGIWVFLTKFIHNTATCIDCKFGHNVIKS